MTKREYKYHSKKRFVSMWRWQLPIFSKKDDDGEWLWEIDHSRSVFYKEHNPSHDYNIPNEKDYIKSLNK